MLPSCSALCGGAVGSTKAPEFCTNGEHNMATITSKIFSYSPSRRDKDVSVFRAITGAHAELLRVICCNSATGYVIDKGTTVHVAKHAADAVARHCIANGWSLGV
jgi:hypothetical protein